MCHNALCHSSAIRLYPPASVGLERPVPTPAQEAQEFTRRWIEVSHGRPLRASGANKGIVGKRRGVLEESAMRAKTYLGPQTQILPPLRRWAPEWIQSPMTPLSPKNGIIVRSMARQGNARIIPSPRRPPGHQRSVQDFSGHFPRRSAQPPPGTAQPPPGTAQEKGSKTAGQVCELGELYPKGHPPSLPYSLSHFVGPSEVSPIHYLFPCARGVFIQS